jgi:hypothetical protein
MAIAATKLTGAASGKASVPARKPAGPRMVWYLAAGVCLVALALIMLAVFRSGSAPKLDASGAELARFVSDDAFRALPDSQKSAYLTALKLKAEQVQSAYSAGKLKEPEYRRAMNYAWIVKQEEHMAKYFRLSPQERVKYLDHLIRLHEKKKAKEASGAMQLEDFVHDAAFEKQYVAAWAEDQRTQYEEYRKALRDRRKQAPATKPAGK